MSDHILTLAKAKLFVEYPELYKVFWKDWDAITEIEHDALVYLIKNSSIIFFPNVKSLSSNMLKLLDGYQGVLKIGV
jgi:hypothetical protein